MGRVQQAELHILISGNIVRKLHAHGFPVRAPGNEIILNHPLDEILRIDGGGVFHAALRVQSLDVVRRDGGRDAVHHAVGECHVLLHPLRQPGILGLDKGSERFPGRVSIVLEVVAG